MGKTKTLQGQTCWESRPRHVKQPLEGEVTGADNSGEGDCGCQPTLQLLASLITLVLRPTPVTVSCYAWPSVSPFSSVPPLSLADGTVYS